MRIRQHSFAKDIVGCSLKMIQNYRVQGMPCHPGKGPTEVWIETTEAIPWILNLFKATNAKRPEKERLSKENADSKAFENALKRRELMKIPLFMDMISVLITDHASQLDSLGGRLANELAGISDPARVKHRIQDETRRLRDTFADGLAKLAQHAPDALGAERADEASAEEERGRVGRQKPGPSARKRRTRTVEE